jgi:nucleotide-binding universal stress UspA family protein
MTLMAQDKDKPVFDPPVTGGVVIGYDGSRVSQDALRWGIEEARLRGWPVHVVRAWTLSTAIRDTGVPFGTVPSLDECEAAVADRLAKALASAGAEGVEVHPHVVHGAAAETLLAAAEGADLLVVGHRGRGGFGGLVLGSVAEQVVRHAPCPVVVVRAPKGDGR